ncbi:hypothetical protein GCM10010261_11840 [Streptomyces pilosus]|uniref:hypothetical protein n=1 Tax=Streptomyces pilosus TaxID=28893 RepID=UPI001672927F|nr:hypothetical protein [Streptomyces pilosus]GGV40525.1 hypothetical protein GCM10010261_11840 [Streptomyces pilosus]
MSTAGHMLLTSEIISAKLLIDFQKSGNATGGQTIVIKVRSAIGATLAAIVVSISGATSASAADWDYLGNSYFQWNSTSGSYLTKKFQSAGGYFKICTTYGTPTATYTIWEHDPDNADDWVGSYTLGSEACATHYVQSFVDGTNKRAELYVETKNGTVGANDYIEFYD